MRKVKAHAGVDSKKQDLYLFVVAEAEKTRMTLNPIPGNTLHSMIVEALSMPAALKKTQADPCARVKRESQSPFRNSPHVLIISGDLLFRLRNSPRA